MNITMTAGLVEGCTYLETGYAFLSDLTKLWEIEELPYLVSIKTVALGLDSALF